MAGGRSKSAKGEEEKKPSSLPRRRRRRLSALRRKESRRERNEAVPPRIRGEPSRFEEGARDISRGLISHANDSSPVHG